MKKLFAFLFLFASPAFAEPNDLGLTGKDCQMLAEYQPSADVAYQPGVDVNGKPVMGADITPPAVQAPQQYSFGLTVDAARYMGLSVPEGLEGQALVGMVTIGNGQAAFNGQPVEGRAMAVIKAFCASQAAKNPPK